MTCKNFATSPKNIYNNLSAKTCQIMTHCIGSNLITVAFCSIHVLLFSFLVYLLFNINLFYFAFTVQMYSAFNTTVSTILYLNKYINICISMFCPIFMLFMEPWSLRDTGSGVRAMLRVKYSYI